MNPRYRRQKYSAFSVIKIDSEGLAFCDKQKKKRNERKMHNKKRRKNDNSDNMIIGGGGVTQN